MISGSRTARIFFALLTLATVGHAQGYDIVIRNGRVLDGMGNPWIAADIGIRGGKIAKIGRIPEAGPGNWTPPGVT